MREKLEMQGALAMLGKEISTLRLQAKAQAGMLRGHVSTFGLMHLDQLDIDGTELSAKMFVDSMRQLRLKEAEYKELEAALR